MKIQIYLEVLTVKVKMAFMTVEPTSFILCEGSKHSISLVSYSKYKCKIFYFVLTY